MWPCSKQCDASARPMNSSGLVLMHCINSQMHCIDSRMQCINSGRDCCAAHNGAPAALHNRRIRLSSMQAPTFSVPGAANRLPPSGCHAGWQRAVESRSTCIDRMTTHIQLGRGHAAAQGCHVMLGSTATQHACAFQPPTVTHLGAGLGAGTADS